MAGQVLRSCVLRARLPLNRNPAQKRMFLVLAAVRVRTFAFQENKLQPLCGCTCAATLRLATCSRHPGTLAPALLLQPHDNTRVAAFRAGARLTAGLYHGNHARAAAHG